MDSASVGNGFVLVYAQNTTTVGGSVNKTFNAREHWVYFENGWHLITTANPYRTSNKINVEQGPLSDKPTPQFNVRFLSPLGSKTWGTYGYLMQNNTAHTESAMETQNN